MNGVFSVQNKENETNKMNCNTEIKTLQYHNMKEKILHAHLKVSQCNNDFHHGFIPL